MGHSTESTVYIKGARERTEMSFGGHGGAVTIMQCDQKRMITISGNQCSVMQTGGSETSCPVTPNLRAMGRENAGAEPTPPRKGGVVTITRNSTDTGERQDMFGYKARHIKTSMIMESSSRRLQPVHMKMETDGWYADLSAGFSCADESYRAMACGGMGGGRAQCSDRIVMKGGGSAAMGYPLKQTTTMMSEHGNFTTTTEVVELTNTTLDAPLFDMPPGCKVTDMSAMMGGATASAQPEASHEPSAPAPKARNRSSGASRRSARGFCRAQGGRRGAHRRGQDQGRERRGPAHRQLAPRPDGRNHAPPNGSGAAGCRRAAARMWRAKPAPSSATTSSTRSPAK